MRTHISHKRGTARKAARHKLKQKHALQNSSNALNNRAKKSNEGKHTEKHAVKNRTKKIMTIVKLGTVWNEATNKVKQNHACIDER
jgi:hypothetical protein